MLRRVLVMIVLATAGACSSDTEQPPGYDAAVVQDGLAALFAGDHPEKSDTEAATCFAESLSGATTPEELREAGILDDRYDVVAELTSLSPEVAGKWVDAQMACTDFYQESARAQLAVTHGGIDPEAYAACLRSLMPEEEIRAAVVQTLTGSLDGAEVSRLAGAQADCARQASDLPAGG